MDNSQIVSKDEQEEIKELISLFLLLSKEDRTILLSNANAFKTRQDIEKARNIQKEKVNDITRKV